MELELRHLELAGVKTVLTMGRRRLFLPAQVSSIQFARDVNLSIFAEDFQKHMQRV